ncbi:spore gernimation protein GerPD [Cohnella caldifontis]|uniref:spore gernimation protein GerPD n=1 Tax=Cohnella caldifontis TaxID=3027471 RepID=UPI0023ED722E|nr:spore gernimation protein GerPD [Cohnella sp. YIM B05605]
MKVVNGPVTVGSVRIVGITSSASLLIGDTDSLTLYSFFDTPPESVVVGPIAPLPSPPEEDVI